MQTEKLTKQKILGEWAKKGYTNFMQNLDEAGDKHIFALNALFPNILESLVFINDKLYYLEEEKGQLIFNTKKDLENLIRFKIGFLSNFMEISSLYTFIKLTNTYKTVKFDLDPFLDRNIIRKDYRKQEIKIVKKDIPITDPCKKYNIKVLKEEEKEILEDYEGHFEGKFLDFLDFIIYMRFTIDRKKSFLNLNACSNWGKGFLMSIFIEDLEIGLKTEVEDLQEGKTGGFTETQFLNSFVIFVDEFKKFKNHLFKVTHHFSVEPKFSFRFQVPVFAKVLLNADMSESFNYLIDEQVANRVLLMQIKNNKKLTDNKLFNKNKIKYKIVIAKFIYNYFIEKIEELKKMGKEQANILSDRQLERLYKKYSIKSNYSIEEIIKENLYSFLQKIRNVELTRKEEEISKNILYINNNVYITKPVQTILNILENELDKAEFSKIAYKKGMMIEILGKEQKTYRLNNVVRKAIKIEIKEIEEYLDENVVFECDKKITNLQDFIYKVRKYTKIEDNEYTIEDNKLKIYSYIVTLQDLNEKLELYNCDLEKMLEEEAGEIKYELEQKINLQELDIQDAEEITENEIDDFFNIKKEDEIDEETDKIFHEILNDTESPF